MKKVCYQNQSKRSSDRHSVDRNLLVRMRRLFLVTQIQYKRLKRSESVDVQAEPHL